MPDRASKKRPRDINQIATAIVDLATNGEEDGPVEQAPDSDEPKKNPAAVALGRLGGLKGGKARAEGLSPERRREIAKRAAEKRWQKHSQS